MARVAEVTHLTAQIPTELHERLKAVAKADDRTVSYEVRQAIKAHVDRLEVERSAALREIHPDLDPEAA